MKLMSPPREITLVAAFRISIERLANLAKKLGPYLWGENTVVGGLVDAQKKLAEGMRAFWTSLTAPGRQLGLATGQPSLPKRCSGSSFLKAGGLS